MRIYIAEKPSLGRAIADVLPKPLRKQEGHIVAGNGDVVTWCVGHLLEQAQPEDYDPEFKRWRFETLPIVPSDWRLKPKAKTNKQLQVLRKLLNASKDAEIVHAGDPDREGQLLVDEVISYLKISKSRCEKIQRCLISDLNPQAVKRSLASLQSNRNFAALSISALARARADWLFGINLTRAFTLRGQQVGYKGVLSVGRVQTPVLGLVVRRDQDIENFESKPYYNVWANIRSAQDSAFRAKWYPSEECEKFLDEQGRNLSRPLAEHVVKRVSHKPALVRRVSEKQNKQSAPLPHNLSSLQIEGNKVYGYSAKKTLELCQRLYETHKLITYPRSDCRYLPSEHFSERQTVISAIQSSLNAFAVSGSNSGEFFSGMSFSSVQSRLNVQQKSSAWNDGKVGAHHAIIPTAKSSEKLRLTIEEMNIYKLVARHYLIQFIGGLVTEAREIELTIENGRFIAKSRIVVEQGWKVLFPQKKTKGDSENGEQDEASDISLPQNIKKGDVLESLQAELEEKITTPPKPFTEATLLSAMTGIGRYVQDQSLKKILKETDGLGTEATRAHILELLFNRGFLQRKGKQVLSTVAGKAFVSALPESTTLPDRTAQWESLLHEIANRSANYDDLMQPLVAELHRLVQESEKVIPIGLKGLVSKNPFRKNGSKRRASGSQASGKKSQGKTRKGMRSA